MPSSETAGPGPVRMQRVAIVGPRSSMRDILARVATTGLMDPDRDADTAHPEEGDASRLLRAAAGATAVEPAVAPTRPDLDALIRTNRLDVLGGEAEIDSVVAAAVPHGEVAAVLGWCPAVAVPQVTDRIADLGAVAAPLPTPPGIDPPTLMRTGGRVREGFAPLVGTYGTVPYPDVDPTLLAGIAYVVMFGMMFGDAGQGAVLLLGALLLRRRAPRRWPRLQSAWPFIAGGALTSIAFGILYGEFFGPTGVLPVLWLSPLAEPVRLLEAAVGLGGVLLAAAYAVAIVNRWREGGPRLALYASAGVAGAVLFLGVGGIAFGLYLSLRPLVVASAGVFVLGLALSAAGFLAETAGETDGTSARVLQAVVQVVDAVIRTGSNLVSFARLAAFGLTHAALAALVWSGTTGLAGHGWLGLAAAVLVFTVGNALTFALEGLVAAIQALRLEFYELFSRVFVGQGRPFRPWYLPPAPPVISEESP